MVACHWLGAMTMVQERCATPAQHPNIQGKNRRTGCSSQLLRSIFPCLYCTGNLYRELSPSPLPTLYCKPYTLLSRLFLISTNSYPTPLSSTPPSPYHHFLPHHHTLPHPQPSLGQSPTPHPIPLHNLPPALEPVSVKFPILQTYPRTTP